MTMNERRPTGRWAPWVAILVMGLVVAAAVFAYYDPESLGEDTSSGGREPVDVQEGIACAPLERVRLALANSGQGDFRDRDSDFRRAVKAAEAQAIRALDTTGISFGRPERVALKIAADVQGVSETRSLARIEERLTGARDLCTESRSS